MDDRARSPALPDDGELMGVLEQAVGEVFALIAEPKSQAGARKPCNLDARDSSGCSPWAATDREAVVEFHGVLEGRVALRCSADGALAIARGLLKLGPEVALATEDVNDALKECANLLSGFLKSKVLDPLGTFQLSVPSITEAPRDAVPRCGALVYPLQNGSVSLEIRRRARPVEASAA